MEQNSFQDEAWRLRWVDMISGSVLDRLLDHFRIHFGFDFLYLLGSRLMMFLASIFNDVGIDVGVVFVFLLETGGLRGARSWFFKKTWIALVKPYISKVGWHIQGLKIHRFVDIFGYRFRHACWEDLGLTQAPFWAPFLWLLAIIFGLNFGTENWMPRSQQDAPGWRQRWGCIAKAKAGF